MFNPPNEIVRAVVKSFLRLPVKLLRQPPRAEAGKIGSRWIDCESENHPVISERNSGYSNAIAESSDAPRVREAVSTRFSALVILLKRWMDGAGCQGTKGER